MTHWDPETPHVPFTKERLDAMLARDRAVYVREEWHDCVEGHDHAVELYERYLKDLNQEDD